METISKILKYTAIGCLFLAVVALIAKFFFNIEFVYSVLFISTAIFYFIHTLIEFFLSKGKEEESKSKRRLSSAVVLIFITICASKSLFIYLKDMLYWKQSRIVNYMKTFLISIIIFFLSFELSAGILMEVLDIKWQYAISVISVSAPYF